MKPELELKEINRLVDKQRRRAASPNATMADDELLDRLETVQDIFFAAKMDGANLRLFVKEMLEFTGTKSLKELAIEHGRQDTAALTRE